MSTQQNNWLLAVVVVSIVGATLYMAIKNNSMDVVNSLATAIVGYYFGVKSNGNPPETPAK